MISQRNPMADVTGVRNHFSRHSKKPVSRFFPFVSKGLVAKVAQEIDGGEQKTEVKHLWASSSRTLLWKSRERAHRQCRMFKSNTPCKGSVCKKQSDKHIKPPPSLLDPIAVWMWKIITGYHMHLIFLKGVYTQSGELSTKWNSRESCISQVLFLQLQNALLHLG